MELQQKSAASAMFDLFCKSEGGRETSLKDWLVEYNALTPADQAEIAAGLKKIGYTFAK